jgi:peptidoglycan/LPS O-acetylase OafA/YrhL
MKQSILYIILVVLFCFGIIASFLYPAYTNIFGISIILLSLAFALYAIFQKHKASQNPRFKIGKDTLILILTILLISFLGGISGLLTNFYISNLFGTVAGFICAILLSFVIGYWARKGIEKVKLKF